MAGDVAETLKKFTIPKTILIGHSMGGKVAMGMALDMPSIVEKLIVVDVSPNNMSIKSERDNMVSMVLPAMLNLDMTQVQSRKNADQLLANSIPVSTYSFVLLLYGVEIY